MNATDNPCSHFLTSCLGSLMTFLITCSFSRFGLCLRILLLPAKARLQANALVFLLLRTTSLLALTSFPAPSRTSPCCSGFDKVGMPVHPKVANTSMTAQRASANGPARDLRATAPPRIVGLARTSGILKKEFGTLAAVLPPDVWPAHLRCQPWCHRLAHYSQGGFETLDPDLGPATGHKTDSRPRCQDSIS